MAEDEARKPAAPADTSTGGNQEAFLSRWSRLKEDARRAPPEPAPHKKADPKEAAPDLPPLDSLTIDSDYRAFFHPKVDENVRRAALKKLFSDPRFNVMDGLDVYIDDYSKTEPIPAAMMAGLRQAQKIFEWAKEDEEERRKQEKASQVKTDTKEALEPPATPPSSEIGLEEAAPEHVAAAAPSAGKPVQA